jgi:hypothetical protein
MTFMPDFIAADGSCWEAKPLPLPDEPPNPPPSPEVEDPPADETRPAN